ncbi:MAG: metallophosphoesterase [Erysipelotrichaceae bacterium]|nr:metallophosphoesterase [Erysipelotrichaceae bacterium]
MNQIFITGDIHGSIDIQKLNTTNFPEGKTLSKDDYVIICGDFGLVWGGDNTKHDKWWQHWLDEKPWTTLFVDGNHENHELLSSYPVSYWHGGRVHKINDSIYHLMRGEYFNIGNYTFFTFGGAFSHDVFWRKEHISWWQGELPTHDEVNHAIDNLEKHNYKADIIISHDAPIDLCEYIGFRGNDMTIYDSCYENIQTFLQYVKDNIEYKAWFMGHYHIDRDILNHHILYNEIIQLTPWYLQK